MRKGRGGEAPGCCYWLPCWLYLLRGTLSMSEAALSSDLG